jgi:hypothetical protein
MTTYWCAWSSESGVASSFHNGMSSAPEGETLLGRDVSQSSVLDLRYHLGMPAPVDGLTEEVSAGGGVD